MSSSSELKIFRFSQKYSVFRSITHDYEAVHNSSTEAETETGVFKNFSYLEQDPTGGGSSQARGKLSSYSELLRNNEDLLASHVRATAPGSRENSVSDTERSTDNDTNNLVNTTHTSQVRL